MPYEIKYTITGIMKVPGDVYEEIEGWDKLSEEERLDEIKSFEEDFGWEAFYEDARQQPLKIESVTKVS